MDREVEQARVDVASRSDFNTYDAFRMFDLDGYGRITQDDLKCGLADIGVHSTHEDIALFFRRYDRDMDGRLDFREFSEALTSNDEYYAHMLARRGSSHRRINIYRKDDIFEYATAQAFKQLMRSHFETEAASESTRQMLARNPFFDATEAFRMVDLNANGLISKDEIRYLMESRGYFISDREARDIAKKFDFNKDGLISYGEFMDEVRPKSPARRH